MSGRCELVYDGTAAAMAAMEAQIARELKATALGIERDAKIAIQTGAKSGRIYERGAVRRKVTKTRGAALTALGIEAGQDGKFEIATAIHRASAPGEAPATDTGNLVNSIHAEEQSKLKWQVAVYVEYGQGLELGTSKVAARPYLLPAFQKRAAGLRARLDALLRRGV